MINLSSSFSGQPRQASSAAYRQLLAENHVDEILLDVKQNGNRERKKELPVWLPQAASFKKGTRKAANAVPSGLYFLDIDEKGLTESLWNKVRAENLIEEYGLVYFAESAGGGTHIWGHRRKGYSIEADIQRLAERLGVSYDSHVTDLSRCCFMVSEQYVKLLDERIFDEPPFEDESESVVPATASTALLSVQPVAPATLPTSYKGIPYERILSQLLVKMGYGNGPVDGERNNALYAVSRYMRFICEFDAERLYAIMPHWGLEGQEVMQTIKSAVNSTRPTEMPEILKDVLTQLESAVKQEEAEQEEDEFQTHIPQKLPPLLQQLADHAPAEFKEAVLIAALPQLGTLATGVRATYRDHKQHSPSFIVSIWAPQATGKSFVDDERDLLLDPIIKQDYAEWQKEMEYSLAQNDGKDVENPKAQIRIIEPNIGVAALIERAIYANGKHLFTYAPEIETVEKNNRGGAWTQKNDLFRLAYDNKEWGQHRISKESFSGKVTLYYNMLMCGTPNKSRAFFSDVEDGLVSRVCFVELPNMLGARLPEFKPWTREETDDVKHQCLCLMDEQGEVALPRINKAIEQWDESKRQEVLETLSESLDTFRRRSALNGFRAGMLAYKLCGNEETDEAVNFAVWVAERCLYYQMKLFGSRLEALNNGQHVVAYGCNVRYLQELSSEFTKEEFVNLRIANGQNTDVRYIISRWVKEGKVVKIGRNLWRKCA